MKTMKLMTKAIANRFANTFPLYSQDGKGENAEVVLKIFNPYGYGTWLITEANQTEDGDWEMFGCMDMGYGWEFGYVMLSELESVRVNVMGCKLPLERDIYCSNVHKTVAELKAC